MYFGRLNFDRGGDWILFWVGTRVTGKWRGFGALVVGIEIGTTFTTGTGPEVIDNSGCSSFITGTGLGLGRIGSLDRGRRAWVPFRSSSKPFEEFRLTVGISSVSEELSLIVELKFLLL